MAMLEKREYKLQVFFSDDDRIRFVKRQLEDSSLVDKDHGNLMQGWKHFYGNQKYFPGYKKLPAGMVTLGFARDIILDPFDEIPMGESIHEKPKLDDPVSLQKWIAKVATNQRHKYQTKRKSTIKEDVVNYCLIGVLILMTLAWLISFVKGLYA